MKKEPKEPMPESAPAEPKKRRRLTDEERIAEREAEIAAIKANQRKRAMDSIADARESIELAVSLAGSCGMVDESRHWLAALAALGEDEEGL